MDAIVEAPGGNWCAVEVKLNPTAVDEAASNLLRFAERVDTESAGSASALAVVVATGYGYTRPDGVKVIPIGALGP